MFEFEDSKFEFQHTNIVIVSDIYQCVELRLHFINLVVVSIKVLKCMSQLLEYSKFEKIFSYQTALYEMD